MVSCMKESMKYRRDTLIKLLADDNQDMLLMLESKVKSKK
jgi:hypothetical protein